jgi:hypothetical protein
VPRAFDGRPDQRNSLPFIDSRILANAQSHAAEPDARDFQVAGSKFALSKRRLPEGFEPFRLISVIALSSTGWAVSLTVVGEESRRTTARD